MDTKVFMHFSTNEKPHIYISGELKFGENVYLNKVWGMDTKVFMHFSTNESHTSTRGELKFGENVYLNKVWGEHVSKQGSHMSYEGCYGLASHTSYKQALCSMDTTAHMSAQSFREKSRTKKLSVTENGTVKHP